MAPEKSPAFQFYPADFLMDGNVQTMTLTERGAYITLLCLCWQEQSLPSEPMRLARSLGIPVAAFKKLWPALERCFQRTDAGWTHKRLDRERQKQAEYRRRGSDAGRASANIRATKRQQEGNQTATRTSTQRQQKDNSSSSSSSSVSDLQSSSPISDLPSSDFSQKEIGDAGAAFDFDRFWARYPKKVGKDEARKAWKKRKPNIDAVLAALEQQESWLMRDGGEFIPNPSTWLNQGRWQDSPPTHGGLSDTARHNLAASEEAGRLIEEQDAVRAHGHRR